MWSWSKWCCKKVTFTWIQKTKISVEAFERACNVTKNIYFKVK